MSADQAHVSQSNSQIFPFFLDRDASLTPGKGDIDLETVEVLNKEQVEPLLQAVINSQPWAIVSTGNTPVANCPGHRATQNIPGFHDNPPAYEAMSRGMEGVLNHVVGMPDNDDHWEKVRFQLKQLGLKYPNKEIDDLSEEELNIALSCVQYGDYSNQDGKSSIKLENGGLNIELELTPGASFEIQLGNTKVTINTEAWLKSAPDHVNGDNKFFQALKCMDKMHLKLELTDEIKELGVASITAPENYQQVPPQNCTFLDDHKGVIDLMNKAGFHGIIADTKDANENKIGNKEVGGNTYIGEIKERVLHGCSKTNKAKPGFIGALRAIFQDDNEFLQHVFNTKGYTPEAKPELVATLRNIEDADEFKEFASKHVTTINSHRNFLGRFSLANVFKNRRDGVAWDSTSSMRRVLRKGRELNVTEDEIKNEEPPSNTI